MEMLMVLVKIINGYLITNVGALLVKEGHGEIQFLKRLLEILKVILFHYRIKVIKII